MGFALMVLVLWLGVLMDVLGRPDLKFGGKALWAVFVILLPVIGSIVYLVLRPKRVQAPETALDEVWGDDPDSLPRSGDSETARRYL
jgi:hypothetical protein